jgi:hypothetical protein
MELPLPLKAITSGWVRASALRLSLSPSDGERAGVRGHFNCIVAAIGSYD